MLTRAPLAFDLSMINQSSALITATPEVIFIVTCPCGGGEGLLQTADVLRSTTPFHFGSPVITSTTTTPRWCFPDPNHNCSTAPSTPIPPTELCSQMASSVLPTKLSVQYEEDLPRLEATQKALSACGFYYGMVTSQRAGELLKGRPSGTFLVRDSADPRHLYSLSVQTDRGPTSVRIHYSEGRFRLDCEDRLTQAMPSFDCVVRLVEHYAQLSRTARGDTCVWLDGSGKRDLRVRLYTPLLNRVQSLQHVCRVALHAGIVKAVGKGAETLKARLGAVEDLELPLPVKAYLRNYSYSL